MVKINSGPVEPTDKFEDVPKEKWGTLMRTKKRFLKTALAYDCRCLVEFCEEAEIVFDSLGFTSAEDMIREGYELDPSQIALAIAWLKGNQTDKPVPLADIVPLAKHGTNQHAIEKAGVGISKSSVGNTNEYLQRRLKRDAPELLDKIETGELSVNAAAIQAGIRKKPTPEDVCVKAFGKCTSKTAVVKSLINHLSKSQRESVVKYIEELA